MIRIEHVLCPVDFSEFSSRALHHAGALAHKHGARLTALHVVPNRSIMDLPVPALTDDERRELTDQVRRFGADLPPEVSVDILVREAPVVSREILHQAKAIPADVLVIGTHGRSGFERFLLGSVTEKAMRSAPCPTLVVPRRAEDVIADEPVRFRRILCAIDFSPASTHALQYTRSMVDEEGGQIVLLHAIEVPPELRANPLVEGYDVASVRVAAEADCLRRLQQLVPEVPPWCSVKTLVREGAAYREILRVAGERSADLIVMGVQGRGAMDLLAFGSNTARVSRGATVPVLTCRARIRSTSRKGRGNEETNQTRPDSGGNHGDGRVEWIPGRTCGQRVFRDDAASEPCGDRRRSPLFQPGRTSPAADAG